ncbi:MAG: LacI family DNA-binding transcriptional regulator [Pseudomonadota bacterium]
MSGRVTSHDVAQRAGVSQSAVSRVFTPGASVSDKTAQKVRAAARDLGYRPNVLARSLITGKSRIIGLVVAYLDNAFYPQTLEMLSTALQDQGYHVLVFMASQTAGNIDQVLEEILDYQVDGLILASVALSSDLAARTRASGLPVVLFNRSQDDPSLSAVTSDNYAGGKALAAHLLACGYRRIGHIAGWEGASTQRDREAGFREGLAAQGVTLSHRALGQYQRETAMEATRQMFAGADRPEAVFVGNDHMALGALDVLRGELGLDVPGDVGVVGFDDVPQAGWLAYRLTTVRQRARAMVNETVRILTQAIDGDGTAPVRTAVPAPLVVRATTRTPP